MKLITCLICGFSKTDGGRGKKRKKIERFQSAEINRLLVRLWEDLSEVMDFTGAEDGAPVQRQCVLFSILGYVPWCPKAEG